MGKPGNAGAGRIIRATRFSAQGLVFAFRNEAAFRQELGMAVVLTPVALWLGQTPMEKLLLILTLLIVLLTELLNSAVEATVDRISDDHHELAGGAKDMGSAAVLVSLVIVAVTWAVIAWQRFAA